MLRVELDRAVTDFGLRRPRCPRDKLRLPRFTCTSTASRVVPGRSLTIIRSEPNAAFTQVDLPTLTRPTIATRMDRTGRAPAGTEAAWRPSTPQAPRAPSGLRGNAEDLDPEPGEFRRAGRWASESTLLATSRTGRPSKSALAICPSRPSRRQSRPPSAPGSLGHGFGDLAAHVGGVQVRLGRLAPVSTSSTNLPENSQMLVTRSRVTPASGPRSPRRPVSRLKSVDLPTLTRPMMTIGRGGDIGPLAFPAGPAEDPIARGVRFLLSGAMARSERRPGACLGWAVGGALAGFLLALACARAGLLPGADREEILRRLDALEQTSRLLPAALHPGNTVYPLDRYSFVYNRVLAGAALVSLGTALAVLWAIWRIGRRLDRIEAPRAQAAAELERIRSTLETVAQGGRLPPEECARMNGELERIRAILSRDP